MREWLYRASTTKADEDKTRELVEQFGFICRSAYADAAQPQLIANVGKVTFQDVIHLYFVDGSGGRLVGAFRVIGPNKHAEPTYFAAALPKTTLRRVAPGALLDRLRETPGYSPDPKLGDFTGWPVAREEVRSPAFTRDLFPGRNALVPR